MEEFISFMVNKRTLRGILHLPGGDRDKYPGIVLCHGFTGNKIGRHRVLVKAARFLCSRGYAVLRFDFSGCGDSDGEHREITVGGQVEEALAAVGYLRQQPQMIEAETYLAGLSMGAAIAALAAEKLPELAGLVLWAPVANLYSDLKEIVGEPIIEEAEVAGVVDYQGFLLGRQFVDSLRLSAPVPAAAAFTGPALVLHGTEDTEIPCRNAGQYHKARQSQGLATEVHLIPGADHTFSAVEWENKVFHITAAWLKQNTR